MNAPAVTYFVFSRRAFLALTLALRRDLLSDGVEIFDSPVTHAYCIGQTPHTFNFRLWADLGVPMLYCGYLRDGADAWIDAHTLTTPKER